MTESPGIYASYRALLTRQLFRRLGAHETAYVVDGRNEIVITWPDEVDSSEVQLSRVADALGARRLPYFYGVYGEIHALSVFDPARMSADFNETVSGNLNRKIVSVGR
jgi:hypothetical protein